MRWVGFMAASIALSASPVAARDLFSIPVTGEFSRGGPAAGQATARSDGVGTFWVQVPGGRRCSGEYSVRDPSPTLVVPVRCTDKRTGQVVITRQPGLMSGTAIVKLSDGTRGQFVFGDITFEQRFGTGGTARTR